MVSPRKSFFQSLDKDERDALLKIAPSLRCAREPGPNPSVIPPSRPATGRN